MQEQKTIEQLIEPLNSVKRVEAPPFLLTRIHAQIQAQNQDFIAPRWVWMTAATFSILLTFNIFILSKELVNDKGAATLIETMNLLPNNNLYE